MSHSFIAVANIVNGVDLDTFPAWLRITHFINFIMMGFLIRSGWEVLASHPRLYWNNHCTPGSEWIKFTKDKVSTVPGEFTARDDQRNLHPLISPRTRRNWTRTRMARPSYLNLVAQRFYLRCSTFWNRSVAPHRPDVMVDFPRGLGKRQDLHGLADPFDRALPAL